MLRYLCCRISRGFKTSHSIQIGCSTRHAFPTGSRQQPVTVVEDGASLPFHHLTTRRYCNKSRDTSADEGEWLSIGDLEEDSNQPKDYFDGVSLERGMTGVFDIEDLVNILRRENVDNLAVIRVPAKLQYVDYMVIGTGRSPRQMSAVVDLIRRIFKRRHDPDKGDRIPDIEGKGNKDWVAVDLGNIVLHVFSVQVRKAYDLETLWTCGVKYDELSRRDLDELDNSLSHFFKQPSGVASSMNKVDTK